MQIISLLLLTEFKKKKNENNSIIPMKNFYVR